MKTFSKYTTLSSVLVFFTLFSLTSADAKNSDNDASTENFNPQLENVHPHSAFDRIEPMQHRGANIATVGELDFNFGFHSIGRVQALSQNDTRALDGDGRGVDPNVGHVDSWTNAPDLNPVGMQTGYGQIDFQVVHGDNFEVFFDLLMATQRHPTRAWGHQGFIYFQQMPEGSALEFANGLFEHIDVKAGNFTPSFGNTIDKRTLNADAQRNPLIGYNVVETHGVEPGLEIIHRTDSYGLLGGAGFGGPEADYVEDRGYSFRAKGWVSPLENMELALSYYTVDHDGASRGTNLFRRERLGSAYDAIWTPDEGYDGGGSEGATQVRPGDGQKVDAFQVDLNWDILPNLFMNSHFGYVSTSHEEIDNDRWSALVGDEDWYYFGADLTAYLTESIYGSVRYSSAIADELDYRDTPETLLAVDPSNAVTDGSVNRFQAGLGGWLSERMLLKVEYVYQGASGFDALEADVDGEAGLRGVAGHVDVSQEPSFSGIVIEFTYSL